MCVCVCVPVCVCVCVCACVRVCVYRLVVILSDSHRNATIQLEKALFEEDDEPADGGKVGGHVDWPHERALITLINRYHAGGGGGKRSNSQFTGQRLDV